MNITKNEYNLHIKPCIDKMYESMKKFNETEKVLATDSFSEILKNEFKFEKLLTNLKSLTDLQLQIAKKYEFGFEELKNYLESKKD